MEKDRKLNKEQKKRLYNILVKRIGGAESNNNYNILNKRGSSASGKYQFLWSEHGNAITEYAKKHGYDTSDKTGRFKNNWFLNNKEFQEKYFEHHVYDYLIPQVEKSLKTIASNRRDLTLDQIAQSFHIQPTHTEKWLKGEDFKFSKKEAKLNSTHQEYIKKGDSFVGNNQFRQEDLIAPSEKREIGRNYIKELRTIKNSKENDEVKRIRIEELNRKTINEGHQKIVNEQISKNFSEEGQLRSMMKLEAFHKLKTWQIKNGFKDEEMGLPSTQNKIPQDIKDGIETHFGYSLIGKNKEGKNVSHFKHLQDEIPDITEDLTGKRFNVKDNYTKHYQDYIKYKDEQVERKKNQIFSSKDKMSPTYHENKEKKEIIPTIDSIYKQIIEQKEQPYGLIEDIENQNETTTNATFEYEEDEEDEEDKEQDKQNVGAGDIKSVDTGTGKKGDNNPSSVPDKSGIGYTDAYIKSLLSFQDPKQLSQYDKDSFKKEIPFEALAGLGIGMAGLEAAKTDIPLRNDQMDRGFLNYMADLKKLSEIGLPAEVEAKAKSDLNSAYQLAMENVTKASGGNRNLVLGNQSQADLSKMEGISALAIADVEQKMKATQLYGEAMKYVADFETNKSIDNLKIKQADVLQKREMGEKMAYAGFQNMIDTIEDAKANAPGTLAHAEKSQFLINNFGYDYRIKDDNTGKPGTKSWYDNNLKTILETNAFKQKEADIVSKFTDHQKNIFGFIGPKALSGLTGQKRLDELEKLTEFIYDQPQELEKGTLQNTPNNYANYLDTQYRLWYKKPEELTDEEKYINANLLTAAEEERLKNSKKNSLLSDKEQYINANLLTAAEEEKLKNSKENSLLSDEEQYVFDNILTRKKEFELNYKK